MSSQTVPFVDLSRIHNPLEHELLAVLSSGLERGDFILGQAVAEFESDFAAYTGVPHAVGVGSGTAALQLATEALQILPGAEVIVPAHTYIASALGPLHAGARPVFCDVDPETGLIDLDSAAAVVSERTEAIVVVHLYGQVCDMDSVARFASRHGIAVIEDAAQAHGARWRDRRAGSFGDASCFSFYPSKNLGALGDGGIICCGDSAVAERAAALRNLGQLVKGDHALAGYNERLDTIQAAVLRVKLPHLDAANRTRRQAVSRYRKLLPVELGLLPARPECEDVHHLFPVRAVDRDGLRARLGERGIATGIHYSPAVHEHEPFAGFERRVELTHSERWATEELSLPIFAGIRTDEVDAVCGAVAAAAPAAPTGS